MKTLSRQELRRVYDRIAWIQDWQAYFEDAVLDTLVAHAEVGAAEAVFEFGCGTGRFAASLLACHLSGSARYAGVDISPVMLRFARRRLAPFGGRAEVRLTDGDPRVAGAAGAFDCVFSHFVLDVLPPDDAALFIADAGRMLRRGGRLVLATMTHPFTRASRAFVAAWLAVRSIRAGLVGGSRPVDLLSMLPPAQWHVRHHLRVVRGGVPIQGVVAVPRRP